MSLRARTDEQLVTAFRAGREDAFAEIAERYRDRLVAYARHMLRARGQSAAEDVVQDVLIRAYRALGADSRPMALRAWLYRIAHNRCLDELRGERPSAELFDDEIAGAAEDPVAAVGRRERLRELVGDIQALPAQQRSALVIREIDGLSYAELAEALDTTVPAIKSLLVRARMNLATAAEAREAAVPAAQAGESARRTSVAIASA